MYIYEALLDVSPVLHAFAKKGTKPRKYTEKPYPLFEKEDEKYTEEQNQIERDKAEMFFRDWAYQFKKKQETKIKK